jgi:hypothetical protein
VFQNDTLKRLSYLSGGFMASEEERRAGLAIERGKVAAGIKDPEARRKFIARQGEKEASGKLNLDELGEETYRERNRQEAEKVLDTYDFGGVIPRDGLYNLARGEQVLPATPVSRPAYGFRPAKPRIPAPAAPQAPIGTQPSPPGGTTVPLGGRPIIASFDSIKSPRTVPQTGVYRLKRGEKVVPAKLEAPDSRVRCLREKQLDKTAPYQGN